MIIENEDLDLNEEKIINNSLGKLLNNIIIFS